MQMGNHIMHPLNRAGKYLPGFDKVHFLTIVKIRRGYFYFKDQKMANVTNPAGKH